MFWKMVSLNHCSLEFTSDELLDLAHPDHPCMSIKVSEHAKLAETRDGSYLDVVVTNNLPCVRFFSLLELLSDHSSGLSNRRDQRDSYWARLRKVSICSPSTVRMSTGKVDIYVILHCKVRHSNASSKSYRNPRLQKQGHSC